MYHFHILTHFKTETVTLYGKPTNEEEKNN